MKGTTTTNPVRAVATSEATAGILLILGFVLVMSLGSLGLWVGKSYLEARTFTRITGSYVSTWEAMWIELRVQQGPQGN